jgi:hypothetical protein
LSLGVQRVIDEDLRLSYLLWEELVLPILAIEVVYHKRRGEYTKKKEIYEQLGILYYVVYNPLRKRKARLEVYRLVQGKYILQLGNRIWLPELSLAIGHERGTFQGITREWLYWYNQDGVRYKTPEELATDAEQRATSAELRAQKLAEQLRKLEINPDEL